MKALLLAAALPLMAACAAPQAAPPAAEVVAAVIVKPRVPTGADDVAHAARASLGRDAGVRYVRSMAGDAHLLHLTAPATREQVPALIERLRASGAYQTVELDSMMKRQ